VGYYRVRYVLGDPRRRHAGFSLRRDGESLFLHTHAALSCAQWDCSASSCSSRTRCAGTCFLQSCFLKRCVQCAHSALSDDTHCCPWVADVKCTWHERLLWRSRLVSNGALTYFTRVGKPQQVRELLNVDSSGCRS
jgi:hypothetical protein